MKQPKHSLEQYDFRRPSGPRQDDQQAHNVIQAGTPLNDNKLIRRLVATGGLSGFAWRACMILLGVLYDDPMAWARTEAIWQQTLQGATSRQLDTITNGLRALIALAEAQYDDD